ncbi:MAG: hypothetical protein PVG39_00840 [Desulfobacteraceae bacterium]|jgi:hypothetical protein
MLQDNTLSVTSATAFDLETVRPGPGKSIKFCINGLDAAADMAITHCDTEGGSYVALMTVAVPTEEAMTFEIPSNAKRYIKMTLGTGAECAVVLDGQTNR